jgi:hypothetical protein
VSVIENIDVVMGARTEQMDAAVAKELKNMDQLRASIDGMSAASAAMTPLAGSIARAVSAYSTSLPGIAAASGIFAASAAAIRASYQKKNDDIEKLAAAMEKLKRKASEAKNEVHAVAKPSILDPRGGNIGEAIGGGSRIGDMTMRKNGGADDLIHAALYGSKADMQKASSGMGRSKGDQAAYEASIDQSLAKTAVYKSAWVDTGKAVSGATGLGVVGIGAMAAGVGVAVAGFAALAHVSGEVRQQMEEIDQTSDAAKKLGMTFKDLETIRFTNKFAGGMDAAATDAAMQKMMVNLSEAAITGAGPVRDKLAALGLDAGRLLQAGPVDAIKQIAAKTAELKNPNDQLLIAYELFGKAGTAMVETLRGGPDQIEKMKKKLEEMGLTLTQAQAEQVGSANDAWDEVAMIAPGAYRQIAAEVSPALQLIAESVISVAGEFNGWNQNIAPAVTMATHFAGTLYDVYEIVSLTRNVMHDISRLDFSKAGEDIKNAYSFDTGDKYVERLNKIREEAANKASKPKEGQDSVLVQDEAARNAAKAAGDEQTRIADEQKRIYDQNVKSAADKENSIKKEIELLSQANAMRAKGIKVNESDLRAIQDINGITAGTGGEYLSKLLEQKNVQEQIKNDMSEADRIKQDQLSGEERMLERARELKRLKDQGMIGDQQFQKAMLKNANDNMDKQPEYKGAASAQAGSVEAYKLLLDRDKSIVNATMKQTAATERAADILEKIKTSFETAPAIRTYR